MELAREKQPMNFLIAHKVRGEPAFDIAIKMDCPECTAGCPECDGLGYWWIIPTSGHRAHPYWETPLSKLYTHTGLGDGAIQSIPAIDPPPDCPDHYPIKSEASKAKLSAILTNLLPKYEPIMRR